MREFSAELAALAARALRRCSRLNDRVRGAHVALDARVDLSFCSNAPIPSLIIGGNRQAMAVSDALAGEGILFPAIRPPTVPAGTARLRISLSAAHAEQDVKRLVDALHRAEQVCS